MGQVAVCPEDDRRRIWYDRPAEQLSRYVTAYDAYDVRIGPDEIGDDVYPPASSAMRFRMTGRYWAARIGRRNFDPMPEDALFGPTSHLGFSRYSAGHVVCVGLTPLGWARFVGRDASHFAERISPLRTVWPGRAEALRATLERTDDPKAAFDGFFTDLLDRTEPEEPDIARLLPLLLDPEVLTIGELGERLDMGARTLARLSTRHFGFTPKLLLRRARFMRALIRLLASGRGRWTPLVLDAGYHDQSHFVRDCQLFLGMSFSAFLRRPKPLFEASLRLRAAVVGAPAQVLHAIPSAAPAGGSELAEDRLEPRSVARR